MGVGIVTDSTSYIPYELAKENNIKIVSLNVILNNVSHREVDLKNKEFYEEMDKINEIPKSSQPSIDELYSAFEGIVKKGDDVVCVFLSSEMSGTYSSAHMVRDMILETYKDAKIQIIDSRTNCMQMGYAVLEGAMAAKNGEDLDSVAEKINHVINNSRFLFVPDTLQYLKKGGRIGGAAAIVGTILQIRPILTVENGKTTVFDKVRTKKKAVDKIVSKFIEDIKENELGDIVVHHINCIDEGMELAKRIGEKLNIEVKIQSIGPVIGVHVGPGSIGIAYYTK